MKLERLFFLFGIFAILASCQFHQNNFSKRKFLDLKKMNDKEFVVMNNEEKIDFPEIGNNPNLEEKIKSSERITITESEYNSSTDIQIPINEIEHLCANQITKSQESPHSGPFGENINPSQEIVKKSHHSYKPKKEKPKTADQYFKLAALIFLLGLLLILLALVGLFKSTMREEVGFSSFFLGLIALIISSIYAIKGSNKMAKEKPRKINPNRRDFVLFFGLFFIVFSLALINGNI